MVALCLVPAAVLVLAFAHDAAAEIELRFRDGSTLVWPSIVEKGGQLCTQMDYGEVCVQKSEVASVRNTDREAEGLYRAPSVSLSEKQQKQLMDKRKRQEEENWRSVEESQRQRMQVESYKRMKHGSPYDD